MFRTMWNWRLETYELALCTFSNAGAVPYMEDPSSFERVSWTVNYTFRILFVPLFLIRCFNGFIMSSVVGACSAGAISICVRPSYEVPVFDHACLQRAGQNS